MVEERPHPYEPGRPNVFRASAVDDRLCAECGRRLGFHGGSPKGPRWCC